MASVQSIALTAACLTAGMRDFCTWNSLGVAYDGPDAERSLLVIWGAGLSGAACRTGAVRTDGGGPG
jgi:hypothetical protein